jgi:DNA-directed RNA polymerase subunit L
MELKVVEEKKGKLVFELPGTTHTVCNILKRELWQNSHVKAAAYTIRHPLIGTPEFIVETDGEEPRKVVALACQNINKDLEKFSEAFKKEAK